MVCWMCNNCNGCVRRSAEFLRGFGFKLHRWVWPKTQLHTNFWVPKTSFYHDPKASKQAIVRVILRSNYLLRSLRVVLKRCLMDLKIGMQLRFGSNPMVEFDSKIPPKFCLPYCTVPIVYSNLGYSGRAAYSDLKPRDEPPSVHK